MTEEKSKNRIEDAGAPWLDQTGKVIDLSDCINACYLASSLLLKELEFNHMVKDSEHLKYEYKRARIIMKNMRENYERALAAIPQRPRLLVPKKPKRKFIILP